MRCARKQETCPICSKSFFRPVSSIYKMQFRGHSYIFCSYTCYQLATKLKDNKQYDELEALLAEDHHESA